MKNWLIGIGLVIIIFLFASFMTMNVQSQLSILIKVENSAQETLLIDGSKSPQFIKIYSLRDTPMNDDIKILTVMTHPTPNNFMQKIFTNSGNYQAVSEWLDSIGIVNYPDYNVSR